MTRSTRRHRFVFISAVGTFIAALLLITVFTFAGCSSDSVGPSAQSSAIQGTVTDGPGSYSTGKPTGHFILAKASSTVQGATVVAMRVMTGGSLTAISDTTQTDANGNFSLACDATNINNVIVVAAKGSSKWEAVVGSTLNQGATEYCQPMSEQTTVQAEIYTRMVADVGADAVTYADVAANVSSSVAAAVQNDATAEAQIATALEAGESAWTEAATNSSIGNASQHQINAVLLARATAEESLESSLYAAGENQTEADSYYQNYEQADLNAYLSEGISAETAAKIGEIFARAATNMSTSADAGVKLAMYQQAARMRAFMIKSAIHAKMQILGATETQIDSADTAGATLERWIRGSITIGQVDAAFKAYHDAILTLTGEAVGANATMMVSVDAKMNAGGGAKAILLAAVASQLSTQALVQAYATFFNAATTATNSGIMSMSSTQVNAVAQILMLTNMTA